jgi:hypothetical protein
MISIHTFVFISWVRGRLLPLDFAMCPFSGLVLLKISGHFPLEIYQFEDAKLFLSLPISGWLVSKLTMVTLPRGLPRRIW